MAKPRRKIYSPLSRYRIWLEESAKYYGVSEEDIVNGCKRPEILPARQTFYWLCWRDKINLPSLSRHLGKDRTTIGGSMNGGLNHRQREVENIIYEKIASKEDIFQEKRKDFSRKGKLCSNVAVSFKSLFQTALRG